MIWVLPLKCLLSQSIFFTGMRGRAVRTRASTSEGTTPFAAKLGTAPSPAASVSTHQTRATRGLERNKDPKGNPWVSLPKTVLSWCLESLRDTDSFKCLYLCCRGEHYTPSVWRAACAEGTRLVPRGCTAWKTEQVRRELCRDRIGCLPNRRGLPGTNCVWEQGGCEGKGWGRWHFKVFQGLKLMLPS